MQRFSHIDTWVFDLDNTLYDAEPHVFAEMGKSAVAFIAERLNVSTEEATILRTRFYHQYGTTLRGLMSEHAMTPDDFLIATHKMDLTPVPSCITTRDYLERLPGRKFVFTNSPRFFAEAMTKHLGIDHLFDGIFAMEDANYWPKPKPDSYLACFAKHGINPNTACMIEDMEVNLRPARDFGMTTVWLHGHNEHQTHPHVQHVSHNVKDWLHSLFDNKKD